MLSVPLILEYEAVLTRPEHLAVCRITKAEVGRVLDDLTAVARAGQRLVFAGVPICPIPMMIWSWKLQ